MLIAAPLRRPNGRRDGSWDLVDLRIFAISAGIFALWVFIEILDYQFVVFGFWRGLWFGFFFLFFIIGLFWGCWSSYVFFLSMHFTGIFGRPGWMFFHRNLAVFISFHKVHLHSITIVVVVVIIIIFIIDCYQLLLRIYFLNGARLFAIRTVNMLGHSMDWSYAKHTLVRWSLSSYMMR